MMIALQNTVLTANMRITCDATQAASFPAFVKPVTAQ